MLLALHFGAESTAHGRVGLGIELTRYWCAVSTFNIRITTKCEIIFHFLLGLVTRLDHWWKGCCGLIPAIHYGIPLNGHQLSV